MSSPTILVIGVGGIGGPAAMALAAGGANRLRLVDPDVVETSNLPRQVVFAAEDVGQAKATVAARRLGRAEVRVEGVVERFDAATAAPLLRDVVVAIDATDGAATKDLVHALVVGAGVPLVFTAALGSEARLLDVGPGGRPCIACIFGFASEGEAAAGDTCARVGVWPAVPGAIGALAAHAALARAGGGVPSAAGLAVLDFSLPRALALRAPIDPACPACGERRRRPVPRADACGPADSIAVAVAPDEVLDLRSELCPMNLLRARRAVDARPPGGELEIWLGAEGAETVPGGLSALGHEIRLGERLAPGLRLVVRRRARADARPAGGADDAWLRRYARQIVLPDLGEAGQHRIARAEAVVSGASEPVETARLHLEAAGVGSVRVAHGGEARTLRLGGTATVERPSRSTGPLARFEAAAAADAWLRTVVSSARPDARIDVGDDGTVRTTRLSG